MKRMIGMALTLLLGCGGAPEYDLVIRNGTIYDGSGDAPYVGDIAIAGDRIAYLGSGQPLRGKTEIDASGLAVAPGFINILSWAGESPIQDGRSQSDIRQGVTLEVFGEGESMGPLNPAMKEEMRAQQRDYKYEIGWTTLGEYLEFMEQKGVSTNIASLVGATTVRVHELGYEDRPPTPEELDRMKALVRQAMEEGALGVGSSLIYAPAFYAGTDELIELCKVASEYGGIYASHLRSEGNQLLEALDELARIAEAADIPAEIYHLKAAGQQNHDKLDQVIEKIEQARARGLAIGADMYTYTAGATGLDATMPPWVQEGGYEAWAARLRDPAIRKKVAAEMRSNPDNWENFFYMSGPEGILMSEFKNPELRQYVGKTIAEVAALRGTSPEETIMDLVIEDGSRTGAVFFLMTEENLHKKLRLPYMSFCSDGQSMAAEPPFLNGNPHPRAYGSFARLLGKYVREEQIITLEEAVRRLTSLTAEKLNLRERGRLQEDFFADVVVFDPQTIADRATFEKPHQYAVGMKHVFVNGTAVLRDGEHTGAFPGQVVRNADFGVRNEASADFGMRNAE